MFIEKETTADWRMCEENETSVNSSSERKKGSGKHGLLPWKQDCNHCVHVCAHMSAGLNSTFHIYSSFITLVIHFLYFNLLLAHSRWPTLHLCHFLCLSRSFSPCLSVAHVLYWPLVFSLSCFIAPPPLIHCNFLSFQLLSLSFAFSAFLCCARILSRSLIPSSFVSPSLFWLSYLSITFSLCSFSIFLCISPSRSFALSRNSEIDYSVKLCLLFKNAKNELFCILLNKTSFPPPPFVISVL